MQRKFTVDDVIWTLEERSDHFLKLAQRLESEEVYDSDMDDPCTWQELYKRYYDLAFEYADVALSLRVGDFKLCTKKI